MNTSCYFDKELATVFTPAFYMSPPPIIGSSEFRAHDAWGNLDRAAAKGGPSGRFPRLQRGALKPQRAFRGQKRRSLWDLSPSLPNSAD